MGDTICYDESKRCGQGRNTEEKCYINGPWGDWMFENCKKSCHYCTPGHPGKIIKDHPHYQDQRTTISPIQPDCHDEPGYSCIDDAKKGHCTLWGDYMKEHCPKSCGYCGTGGICADDDAMDGRCPEFKERQGCDIEWMRERCAKTCDTCIKQVE